MKRLSLFMLIFCLWAAPALALPYELIEDGVNWQVKGFELDGNFAVITYDQQAEIWTREPRRKIHVLNPCQTGSLKAFFVNHQLITKCISSSGYQVWDPQTGKLISQPGSGRVIQTPQHVSPDSPLLARDDSRLAYSEKRNVMKLWDAESGKLRHKLEILELPTIWKYTETHLAVVTKQEIQIWELANSSLKLSFPLANDQIADLALDQNQFAISYQNGTIEIRSFEGERLQSFQAELNPFPYPLNQSGLPDVGGLSAPIPPSLGQTTFSHRFEQLSLQGDWLAGSSKNSDLKGVTLLNLKTAERRQIFEQTEQISPQPPELGYPWLVAGDWVYHFPDGRQGKLKAARILPRQRVWLNSQGHELQIRSLDNFKVIHSLYQDPDYDYDYAENRVLTVNDDQIIIHDLNGKQTKRIRAGGQIEKFVLAGKNLISFGQNDQLMLWDLKTHQLIQDISAPGPISAVALKKPWLAFATREQDYQNLFLYNSEQGEWQFSLNGPQESAEHLALDSKQLWTSSGSVLQSWNFEARQLQQTVQLTYNPALLFPDAGVVINHMSLLKSDEIDPFLRWNPLIKRFEPWSIQEAELKTLLQSDAVLIEEEPLIFTNGHYQPFAPNVAQAQENLWWQKDHKLHVLQTTQGQLQLHSTDLISGQRQLIYSENASEVSILDANAERILLRQSDQGLIRIDWSSGKIQPWLKDYKPPINAVTGIQTDKIIGNLLFQLELFPESAYTRISVWDLEANQLKYRFKSDKILSDIKARFSASHVLLSGKKAYNQEQYFLQAWSLNNGQMFADRQLASDGCDSQFAYQPALQTASSTQLVDGQNQIQICDFKGQRLAQYKLKQQAVQQPFLAANKLYLIQSNGSIEIREPLSGRLTQRLDTLARHLTQTQHRILNILETDGYLTIQTGEIPSASTTGQNQQSITVILELKTGQFFKLPGWISILTITDQSLTILFNDGKQPRTVKAPRNKLAQAASYLDPSLQPMVYSFNDGLFMLAPDGSFVGYGNYQQYLHINQTGQIIPWDEAIRRWQKPGSVILNNP